ncbi:acetyl ornithine aminotransferase family protein [Vogesella oryzae]|uniref:acetyl ornithine aminotransferase family protein n=1 Tax=Vogesella oryzae TaxID=1735285 RepID=UPI001583ADA9|nr:acetyl ornithine aminotransferase family protein [Vogesella oryzae]
MQNPHIRTELPGPRARALLERDQPVVSPSYPRDYPFVMDHGRGAEVWDVDGNRFIDFTSGIAVTSTGHAHPRVVAAIKDAADKFLHCSSDFWHEGQVQLAETINRLSPMGEPAMSFFTNSGTEAVEGALKLARYVTGRSRFIGFIGGFHGRTMGSLAFTASKYTQQQGFFPAMPGVTHIPYPNNYRPLLAGDDQGKAVLNYLENVLFQSNVPPSEVAGILIEPLQGEGGYLTPPPGFLQGLRALCDKYGILLIADEVQTGVGRTGKMFAVEHEGVHPDIMTLAKGLGSGMPIGLVVAKKRLMEQWKRGAHGNTYGGNPVCCAAANATLQLVEEELLENTNQVGKHLIEAMQGLAAKYPMIGEVRGKGLWIGIEFVKERSSKAPAREFVDKLLHTAFHNGLLLLSCGVSTLRLMPPLMISRELADEAVAILDQSIAETLQQLGS